MGTPAGNRHENERTLIAVPVVTVGKELRSGRLKVLWDKRLQGEIQAAREPHPKRSTLVGPGAWLEARGCSSDGRALQSHCRGQGFDSPQLHQPNTSEISRLLLKLIVTGGQCGRFGIALVSQHCHRAGPVIRAHFCFWWEAERQLSDEYWRIADGRSCGADVGLAPVPAVWRRKRNSLASPCILPAFRPSLAHRRAVNASHW